MGIPQKQETGGNKLGEKIPLGNKLSTQFVCGVSQLGGKISTVTRSRVTVIDIRHTSASLSRELIQTGLMKHETGEEKVRTKRDELSQPCD